MKFKKILTYILLVVLMGTVTLQGLNLNLVRQELDSVYDTLKSQTETLTNLTKFVAVQTQSIATITTLIEGLQTQVKALADAGDYLLSLLDPKPNIEKSISATVQIKVGRYGGAGVVIKDDGEYLYVLTAKHVIEPRGKVEMVVTNSETNKRIYAGIIPRKNIYKAKQVDLALLKLPRPEGTFDIMPLAEEEPKIGATIYTIGHPVGTKYSVNIGLVSNYIKNPFAKRQGTYMLISAPSIFGNSGGAVINNKSEVVGIVSGIMWLGKNPKDFKNTVYIYHMALTIRLDDIKELLEEVK